MDATLIGEWIIKIILWAFIQTCLGLTITMFWGKYIVKEGRVSAFGGSMVVFVLGIISAFIINPIYLLGVLGTIITNRMVLGLVAIKPQS